MFESYCTFSGKYLQSFCRRQKQHYCGDLVLGSALWQKPVFNHQQIGFQIKTLENYLPSYILTYSSEHQDLTSNQR